MIRNKDIKEKTRGITLIALVITVVILIILATVTLNVVLGEGGLIERAKLAKELTEEAAKQEQDSLNKLVDEYANIMAEDENIKEPIEISIKESHTTDAITIEVETNSEEELTYKYYINGEIKATQNEATYTENITLANKEPYIPSGFKHTEGTVEEGYVIKDISIGNEFVWIPVASGTYKIYVEVEGKDGSTGKSEEITAEISELTRQVENGSTAGLVFEEEEGSIEDKKSIAYFKHSVVENSGFYMGRYEMGMPGQKSGDAPELEFTNEARNVSGVPVCVGQVMPWTNIDWDTAKANLESMYNGEVQSAMLNSYARNTTLNWLQDSGIDIVNGSGSFGNYNVANGNGSEDFYFKGSFTVVNYGGIIHDGGYATKYESIGEAGEFMMPVLIETGADTNPSKRHALNNIYDLAGNASEWTTEKKINEEGYRISGGDFNDTPNSIPIIDGNVIYSSGTNGSIYTSSRPILYK